MNGDGKCTRRVSKAISLGVACFQKPHQKLEITRDR